MIGNKKISGLRPGKKSKDRGKVRKFTMPVIRHVVVHRTATMPNAGVQELTDIPFHYVVTKAGKVLKFMPIECKSKCIQVAYLGGLDRAGKHCDTRTAVQNDGLFRVLVQLTDLFPKATIIGADEIYVYGHANPGFSIKGWLNSYIPEFLQAA